MFDNFANWQAPMLAGGEAASMQRLGDQMQDAWIAFARSGDPQHAGIPAWSRFGVDANEQHVMLFDTESRVVADPAGRAKWRYWA